MAAVVSAIRSESLSSALGRYAHKTRHVRHIAHAVEIAPKRRRVSGVSGGAGRNPILDDGARLAELFDP